MKWILSTREYSLYIQDSDLLYYEIEMSIDIGYYELIID